MLISEVKKWYFVISWDNASPADSKKLRRALAKLGKVKSCITKTSVVLAPKASVDHLKVRRVLERHLHPRDGNAFYGNFKSREVWQIGQGTGGVWKRLV